MTLSPSMADEDTERPRRPRWVSILRTVAGIALGIGSAVLVGRLMGLDWSTVITSLRSVRPLPLLAAVGGTFVLLALQALRWRWVVRPVLPLKYREAFAAMLVASAFNVLIPARGGDLIRVQYLGKRTGTSRVTLLGTELLDYWSDKAGWVVASSSPASSAGFSGGSGRRPGSSTPSASSRCWSSARERWRSSRSFRSCAASRPGWIRALAGSRSSAPGSPPTTAGACSWWSCCSLRCHGSGRCQW